MKYYIKVNTGLREDQFITIPMQEAHKVYHLFNNPKERGIFESGIALIGTNIREVKPDFHATMGWNPTHRINEDDWNELNGKGIAEKMEKLLSIAKDVVRLSESKPDLIKLPLVEAMKLLPENLTSHVYNQAVNLLSDKFKI